MFTDRHRFLGIVAGFALATMAGNAHATLYGVTGQAASSPGSLYTIDTGSAAATFVQALTSSNGESIAYDTTDGLMYHWSNGMESVNLGDGTITNVTLSGYGTGELWGSTYDAGSNVFYVTDIHGTLATITPGGVTTLVGALGDPNGRGIAFVGSDLYVGSKSSSRLYNVDAGTGATNSSVNVTMSGFTVSDILGLTVDGSGTLYGLLGANDGRHLATLDPTTGVASDIGLVSESYMANIEFVNPTGTPEPGTLGLVALGIFALRRRRTGT